MTLLQNEISITNVQNICNFVSLELKALEIMRKAAVLVISILFFSCTNSGNVNDCFPFVTVNETINLDLPQYIDLQVPGGWAYAPGGLQGLIVYNINGQQFKAYDRLCPGQNLSSCSQMIVDSNLRILCQCDDAEFNILNGSPLTAGVECFANEYLVENLNGSLLRITNF